MIKDFQHCTSKDTSVNSKKLPSLFHKVKWEKGTTNWDYGGGKFHNVSEYLETQGVANLLTDPFNQTERHNKETMRLILDHPPHTVTCANVLNVIDTDDGIKLALDIISEFIASDGTLYVQIYEGNKSGIGKVTKQDCYQRNCKTIFYIPFLKQYFNSVEIKGNIITAKEPRR